MQPDTIVPDPTNPQSFNRYTYVSSNPLKYIDPTGNWWEDPETGALMPGYSPNSLPDSWQAGKKSYRNVPPPQPVFEKLPLEPTSEARSQWFGATDFAYRYGHDWNYHGYCQGYHCGIDIGRIDGEYGNSVYAGIYGRVISVVNQFGAGPYAVNIRVGNYIVIYGHLDGNYKVEPGELVTPDTILAGVGNPDGNLSKGNIHIHLEVRYSTEFIYNPVLFMLKGVYDSLKAKMYTDEYNYTDVWTDPANQPVVEHWGKVLWPPSE